MGLAGNIGASANVTVALDGRFTYRVNRTIKIRAKHTLELTSYCVATAADKCDGNQQKAKIDFSKTITEKIFLIVPILSSSSSTKDDDSTSDHDASHNSKAQENIRTQESKNSADHENVQTPFQEMEDSNFHSKRKTTRSSSSPSTPIVPQFKVNGILIRKHTEYTKGNLYLFYADNSAQTSEVIVEMMNCGVKVDISGSMKVFLLSGAGYFKIFTIRNVSFEGVTQQQPPSSKNDDNTGHHHENTQNSTAQENVRAQGSHNSADHENVQTPFQEIIYSNFHSKHRTPFSSQQHDSRNSLSSKNSQHITLKTLQITGSLFTNFDIQWQTLSSNVEMHQNILNKSLLNIQCGMECHIRINAHRHYASPTILAFYKDGDKSNIEITNTTSTGQKEDDHSTDAHLDIVFRDKTRDSKVSIEDCDFGDSTNIVGVSIRNVASVSILNTRFYNIHVTDVSALATDKRAAAGVTIVSTKAYLHNLTFTNVSAVSFFPSSLYVKLTEFHYVGGALKMDRILIETKSLQVWENDVMWHFVVESIITRRNVTVRCLGGDQSIRKFTSRSEEYLYCTRCNTSSYNVQNPAFVWEKPRQLIKVNNTCHDHCPYQASCVDKLKSRGNYWGLVTNSKSGIVEFFQCPIVVHLNEIVFHTTHAQTTDVVGYVVIVKLTILSQCLVLTNVFLMTIANLIFFGFLTRFLYFWY